MEKKLTLSQKGISVEKFEDDRFLKLVYPDKYYLKFHDGDFEWRSIQIKSKDGLSPVERVKKFMASEHKNGFFKLIHNSGIFHVKKGNFQIKKVPHNKIIAKREMEISESQKTKNKKAFKEMAKGLAEKGIISSKYIDQ